METLILEDGSRWIKTNPKIDWYYNLDDYEKWLLDITKKLDRDVWGIAGVTLRYRKQNIKQFPLNKNLIKNK